MSLRHYFPILEWGRYYQRADLVSDEVAAVIVTMMLIPQSLAYALLAGVPLQAGLYASVVPLLVYALLGSSHSLAVGPVAVVSLMTDGSPEKNRLSASLEWKGVSQPPSGSNHPITGERFRQDCIACYSNAVPPWHLPSLPCSADHP